VKSTAQQAEGMVLKVRETLVCQRTQLVNAPRRLDSRPDGVVRN
jgi:hypothetical protein